MEASFFTRHPVLKDALNIIVFIILVIIGTSFINAFVFRSFNVLGPSMEETLHTGDRLLVNRLPVTWAQLQGKAYVPERGQVIVFENPRYTANTEEQFIVKRVIGLPGERVVLENGQFTVYNDDNPNGFDPDSTFEDETRAPISGAVNTVVPDSELFVVGDNRVDNHSFDSRSGLGTIPLYDVVGPVGVRIFPFNQIRGF
ncbi:signal peptidase I [Candidatus Saccharibacteria bacterium]|nr:signal peptidase I [Candidatus Saccharibacteria bacterium]MBJ58622.1 signal peptidase I [Candidatus Saccharibacteria bacterium]MBQ68568.1 signal peptidase I [Candidatus Saccharibacteria bacterium]|tara:strand:+ start:587 stop:1186 length:600 start_codon:yes stop_codon:yes gene_type:complete